MMELLPKSKIASMSTGHFAGLLADTFEHQIPEKKCYGQLLPDIEGKERAMKHELPIVNDFRPADYKVRFDAEMKLIRELELQKKSSLLFAKEIGYIEFYGSHLDKVAKTSFTNGTKERIFKSVVKELRLFDYKGSIVKLFNAGAGFTEWKQLFAHIVEEFLVQAEMDRVAQAEFDKIINEVDELVKDEYRRSTGKELKSAIFDEKKINGEIAKSLNNSETEVAEFMDNFEKGLKDSEMNILADIQEESQNIFEEKFSSHPIENFE